MPRIDVKHTAIFEGEGLSKIEVFSEASRRFELDDGKRKQLKVEPHGSDGNQVRIYSEFLVEYNKGESGDDVKHCVRNDIHQMFEIGGYLKSSETIEMRRKPERIIRKKKRKA